MVSTFRVWENLRALAAGIVASCVLAGSTLSAQSATGRKNTFEVLDRFSSSVQALSEQVAPSVVQIVATRYGAREESSGNRTGVVIGRQQSVGSGVIVDPDGYIVTNAHVVNGAQRIRVTLSKSATQSDRPASDPVSSALAQAFAPPVEATLIGEFKEADLALLKIPTTGLRALPFADYNKLRQGQVVFAFGSREGLNNSVSMGVVSSVARQPDPDSPFIYVQTDAAINPGDSGGPLVNTAGEIVGLDTFILTQSGGSEGLGFAIPSPLLKIVCEQLRKQGHFHRIVIGIGVQTITPTLAAALHLARDSGVMISDVVAGSPAAVAGLKLNDIILAVDGKALENVPRFMMSFLLHGSGPLHLDIRRGDATLTIDAAAVEESHAADRITDLLDVEKGQIPRLGILGVTIDQRTESMVPNLRAPYGVFVAARSDTTGAIVTGLQSGDVIHEINGVLASSLESLRTATEKMKHGDPVALLIERESKLQYLGFEIE